jgi:hypothetical protein
MRIENLSPALPKGEGECVNQGDGDFDSFFSTQRYRDF